VGLREGEAGRMRRRPWVQEQDLALLHQYLERKAVLEDLRRFGSHQRILLPLEEGSEVRVRSVNMRRQKVELLDVSREE
jgi:hypothetical protein